MWYLGSTFSPSKTSHHQDDERFLVGESRIPINIYKLWTFATIASWGISPYHVYSISTVKLKTNQSNEEMNLHNSWDHRTPMVCLEGTDTHEDPCDDCIFTDPLMLDFFHGKIRRAKKNIHGSLVVSTFLKKYSSKFGSFPQKGMNIPRKCLELPPPRYQSHRFYGLVISPVHFRHLRTFPSWAPGVGPLVMNAVYIGGMKAPTQLLYIGNGCFWFP